MTVANSHGASGLILDMLDGTGSDVDNRRGEESAARDTTDSQKIRQVGLDVKSSRQIGCKRTGKKSANYDWMTNPPDR